MGEFINPADVPKVNSTQVMKHHVSEWEPLVPTDLQQIRLLKQ